MTKLSPAVKKLIESKRSVLLEEPHDYWKDYKAGTISYQEYLDMVREYERSHGGSRRSSGGARSRAPRKRKVRRSKGGFVYSGVRQDADSEIAAMVDPLEAILNDPGARISRWEREFLQSVIDQLDYGKKTELSPKQDAIVKRILAKAGPAPATGSDADGDGRSDADELIDIAKLREEQKGKTKKAATLMGQIKEQSKEIGRKKRVLKNSKGKISRIDVTKLMKLQREIEALNKKEKKLNKELAEISKKEALLHDHEYDPDCKFCSDNKFVREANLAVASKELVQYELQNTVVDLAALNPSDVFTQLMEHTRISGMVTKLETEITQLDLERERNKTVRSKIELALKDISLKITEYEDNKEAIENLEMLLGEKRSLEKSIKSKNKKIASCEEETLDLVKLVGSYEQRVETLREQKQEYHDLRSSFAAYDLFMRCMHPNGIAYDVIKKKIPVINQEIAKVLANIVEFEIFFESSGNKFDIFIKHPQYDERPIEMASGAEKTMAAMAIRLALLSVSSLPKGDLFILDEPGTALDEENMEGFIRILELIKVYFKNVLLISHLDSLKDCVDMQIVIDKKRGYARVNQ